MPLPLTNPAPRRWRAGRVALSSANERLVDPSSKFRLFFSFQSAAQLAPRVHQAVFTVPAAVESNRHRRRSVFAIEEGSPPAAGAAA